MKIEALSEAYLSLAEPGTRCFNSQTTQLILIKEVRMRQRVATALLALCLFLPRIGEAVGASLLNFQAGGILAFHSTDSNTFSGQVAWTPLIHFGVVGVRGDLGLTVLKNGLHNRFLVINAEGLLSVPLLPGFAIEGGGGMHSWTDNNGGVNPALTGNLVFFLRGLDRIYLGYTRLFLGEGVNEVRAGVGFRL